MKILFRRYFNSVLRPGEFSKVEGFICDKNNEKEIHQLMTPFWNKEMETPLKTPKSNPVLFERIRESILHEKFKLAKRKIKLYTWGLRAAAVLVVALLISNMFIYQQQGDISSVDQLQTIKIPYGAKTNVTLPDGSSVWLNSGTTLSYPMHFSKNRSVRLVGEAFFEVVKSDIPFIVSTSYGDVKVKGTSFNVNAFLDDNYFETTLVEGVVALTEKNEESEFILKPGQQAIKTANGFKIDAVETKYFTSWKEGKLIFNHEPFPSFIKKLERWYNVKIKCEGNNLDELWYSGTLEMESISEVMEMISKAAPVIYSFNDKTREFTLKTK